jgi:hypothetical protein
MKNSPYVRNAFLIFVPVILISLVVFALWQPGPIDSPEQHDTAASNATTGSAPQDPAAPAGAPNQGGLVESSLLDEPTDTNGSGAGDNSTKSMAVMDLRSIVSDTNQHGGEVTSIEPLTLTADEPSLIPPPSVDQLEAMKTASKKKKAAKGYELSRLKRGEPADDLEGALEFEFNMTKDPATGKIPEGIYEAEKEQAREIVGLQRTMQADAIGSYTFEGPNNLGGRTRSIAYDVRYDGVANRTILACGVSGGVYKSTDDGANWTRKSPTGEHFSCTSLAQDPRPTFQDTWYYAVGEASGNSASGTGAFYLGNGVYKSVDNGETWARLPNSNTTALETFSDGADAISKVAVDPTNGNVYMAALASIRRSTNGGTTWTPVLSGTLANSGQMTDIVITSTGRLYAAFSGFNSNTVDGVWTSTTGASGSWTQIAGAGNGNSPVGWNGDLAYGRVVLAVAPSNENILYALYYAFDSDCDNVAAPEAELFRWDQGATAWTNLSATLPNEVGCSNGNDPFAVQGGYDLVVAVKPDDPATIFIGGTNIYRSTNTGATWTRMGGYATAANYAQYVNSHPDIHAIVFQPGSSTTMLCGNDGGIQRTTNNLAPVVAWTQINNGYRTYQYYYVVNDPRTGNSKVMGGAQDNGTTRNVGGVGSVFESVFSGDGVAVGLTDLIGGLQFEYVGAQRGRLDRRLATDVPNASTFITPVNENGTGLFVTLFKLDPDNTQRLYYANDNFLYRTTSASTVANGTWTSMGGIATAVGAANDITAIGLTRGAYSAATSSLFFGTSDGRVFRLDDPTGALASTTPVNITGAGFPAASYVSSIAVHPTNDDIVMVTFSNYNVTSVFWTNNANSPTPTWTNVENNLTLPSFRSSAIVTAGADVHYFVGTSAGLYSASNISAGNPPTWVQESPGELGNVVVSSLDVRPSDRKLLVGTHGYGMWSAMIGAPAPTPTATATVAPTPTATATVAPTPTATATVAPTPTATATVAPPVASISGSVSYGTTPTGQGPRFVPGVGVAAAGLVPLNVTTNASGAFLLTGFGLGAYTVTPSKTGDINASISGLDAARVAQHVAGLITLNANQQVAGDATNNGGLSGLDAARIAQHAAGLTNPGIAGQWKFIPDQRTYAGVASAVTGQDFEAILVGEVTGNWTAPAPRLIQVPDASPDRLPAGRTAATETRGTLQAGGLVSVSLPADVAASGGRSIKVPIVIGQTTGRGIVAYDFVLTYDAKALRPELAEGWAAKSISEGWSVVVNTDVPGEIRVTAYSTVALSGSGALLNLNFRPVGGGKVAAPLKFTAFQLNEGQVPAAIAGETGPAAGLPRDRSWFAPRSFAVNGILTDDALFGSGF